MSATATVKGINIVQEMPAAISFALLGVVLIIGALLVPPAPFIIDGGIYLDMARAMADHGALHIAANGNVEGAPALTKYLTHDVNGLVYPQYPSGYAFVAAPFYTAFGVRGLILMNALSAVVSIWLTWRIALTLYNEKIARAAAFILLIATFFLSYAVSIWPQALSLTIGLGAIYTVILATQATHQQNRALLFVGSGLLIGAGIHIRVDAILIFPVVFFWLRLFALPQGRLGPVLIIAGAAPLMFFAAWLNQVKFGAFTPLSYGPHDGADNIASYAPVIFAGTAVLIGIWLVNVPATLATIAAKVSVKRFWCLAGITSVAVALIGWAFLWKIIYGVYVLIINLQAHDAYYQEGVDRNAFGHLLFWGYAKKALIQSLPFLPLVIMPIAGFLRGKNLAAVSLCLLAISAPVVFYALNQWHGGGSYNMRYFMPALPFLSILSAAGLFQLTERAVIFRQTVLLIIFAAAALYLTMQTIGQSSEPLYAPTALYPQWLIALLCAGGAIAFLHNPSSGRRAQAVLGMSIFALSYSMFLSFSDITSDAKARAQQHAIAQEIAAALPDKALILTRLPILLINAEREGSAILVADDNNIARAAAGVTAFERAGRCVYFQNSMVANAVAPRLPDGAINAQPLQAGEQTFPDDPRLAFYILRTQRDECAF